MFEIEMPCCGTTSHIEELADVVGCETCNVVLELDSPTHETLLAAA